MKYSVEEGTIEEAKSVHAQMPEFEYPQDEIESRLGGKFPFILVAKGQDSQLIGYLISYNRYNDGSLYCWIAGVIPSFRRQGVLRELMRQQELFAKEKQFSSLKIKTMQKFPAMISFLKKDGYRLISENQKMLFEKKI